MYIFIFLFCNLFFVRITITYVNINKKRVINITIEIAFHYIFINEHNLVLLKIVSALSLIVAPPHEGTP